MSKKLLVVICILEAIAIIFLLIKLERIPEIPTDVPTIEIVRDSIIRDSIFIEIEKIKREIVYIDKDFAEDSVDIMSANDSVLFRKFERYIEDYNNK